MVVEVSENWQLWQNTHKVFHLSNIKPFRLFAAFTDLTVLFYHTVHTQVPAAALQLVVFSFDFIFSLTSFLVVFIWDACQFNKLPFTLKRRRQLTPAAHTGLQQKAERCPECTLWTQFSKGTGGPCHFYRSRWDLCHSCFPDRTVKHPWSVS